MKKLPFEKRHIKIFTLLYSVVVVVILLFYILNTNLNSVKNHEKKEFEKTHTTLHELQNSKIVPEKEQTKVDSSYKLLAPLH